MRLISVLFVARHEATFNGFGNRTQGHRIDYVFHSRRFRLISAQIVRTIIGKENASDSFSNRRRASLAVAPPTSAGDAFGKF